MKHNYDMKLLESMILSNNILLTEAPCVFPDGWNQDKGDAFRAWFNGQYPSKSAEIKLDKTGPFDNAVIKSAYCWKPYGLETAGDLYMQTAGEEDYTIYGYPVRYYLIAAGLVVVAAGVGFVWWYKVRNATKLAKAVTNGIKNYKGDKADLLYDTITSFRDPAKRAQIIRKLTRGDKKNQLTSAEEKAQIEQLANNPDVVEKTVDKLHELYLQEFKLGNLTANEYIRAVRMNPNSVEAKALKAIERARKKSGNKQLWPSKQQYTKLKDKLKKTKSSNKSFKTVSSNPKLTYQVVGGDNIENSWFHFKGNGKVSQQSVATAYSRALNNANLPAREALIIKNGPGPASLENQLNGKGQYMLAKHANAETFPTINQWTIDMNRAGANPQVTPGDISRYIKHWATWHLVNRPI